MTTEWMKVMLEEIERKKQEAEQAQLERMRREQEAAHKHAPEDPLPGR
jgi:hypothetical protein